MHFNTIQKNESINQESSNGICAFILTMFGKRKAFSERAQNLNSIKVAQICILMKEKTLLELYWPLKQAECYH